MSLNKPKILMTVILCVYILGNLQAATHGSSPSWGSRLKAAVVAMLLTSSGIQAATESGLTCVQTCKNSCYEHSSYDWYTGDRSYKRLEDSNMIYSPICKQVNYESLDKEEQRIVGTGPRPHEGRLVYICSTLSTQPPCGASGECLTLSLPGKGSSDFLCKRTCRNWCYGHSTHQWYGSPFYAGSGNSRNIYAPSCQKASVESLSATRQDAIAKELGLDRGEHIMYICSIPTLCDKSDECLAGLISVEKP